MKVVKLNISGMHCSACSAAIDKNLQKIDNIREEWDDMISPINLMLQDKLRFEHPITYRIYRSWDDLEEYQMLGINKARIALEGKENV